MRWEDRARFEGLRTPPREDRDLFIAANNGQVLPFDNVSGLPAWISDTLCRLATGGAFAVRQLYPDQGEVLFDAARPVILNGIGDIVTRPVLADWAIFLTLEAIPEERRRPEKELWSAGTFGATYAGNRDEAVDSVIEADPVGSAIRSLISRRTEWTGTTSDLLGALDEEVGKKVRKSRAWRSSARALAGRVHRAATFLRKVGINITFERGGRAWASTGRTC